MPHCFLKPKKKRENTWTNRVSCLTLGILTLHLKQITVMLRLYNIKFKMDKWFRIDLRSESVRFCMYAVWISNIIYGHCFYILTWGYSSAVVVLYTLWKSSGTWRHLRFEIYSALIRAAFLKLLNSCAARARRLEEERGKERTKAVELRGGKIQKIEYRFDWMKIAHPPWNDISGNVRIRIRDFTFAGATYKE